MVKVEIDELDDFLKTIEWSIFAIGERKKGDYVYATKENYKDGIKPAGVEVLMIELI